MEICFSTACLPGRKPIDAIQIAKEKGACDPVLGILSFSEIQLCPQNCIQKLDEESIENLMSAYPDTLFRLHANVRVSDKHIQNADLSSYRRYKGYFSRLADISDKLSATAYTLHAGKRAGTWKMLLDNRKQIEDLFAIPVGIEGLYPVKQKEDYYWINSWKEYQLLLESDIPFALDLSHLNIVYHHTGKLEINLVQEMSQSDNCIEVHCSANNGEKDSHSLLQNESEWWLPLLKDTRGTIFFEGNLRSTLL